MPHLGMIAGAGDIPEMIARQAQADGHSLPTIALSPQVAAQLRPHCTLLAQHGPGQLGKIIHTLQRHAIERVVIVGKVDKRFFFETPRLDFRTLRGLSSLHDYRDMTVLRALAAEFTKDGIEVIEQTRLLSHLVTPEGVLGKRQPSRREWTDVAYGFAQAKQLAALDIGQAVVLRRQTILAVEAVEGTDAAIQRGCQHGRRGTVVVKVNRPHQDMRFDVPTVGLNTLATLIAGRASVLAVEAGSTVMLHLPQLITIANAHRLTLLGVSPELLQQHRSVICP